MGKLLKVKPDVGGAVFLLPLGEEMLFLISRRFAKQSLEKRKLS
jgi:hypothetical protein